MRNTLKPAVMGALLSLAGLGLAQGPLASDALAADAFAVGMVPGDVTSMAPWFAQNAGLYDDYDLEVEIVTIQGGSRGVQVLLSGNIQAMLVGFSTIVRANQQGADLRAVSSSSNVMPMDFYVVPEIKTAEDLKGKAVAISSFTAESDMAVSLALQQLGLTRDDVTVTQLGGSSNRIAGMEAGHVVGAPFVAPSNKKAEAKGYVRMVDLSQDGAPYIFNGMTVNSATLSDNRDVLKRFVKGTIEGAYKAISDEAWARGVIAEQFKTDSEPVIDEAYSVFVRAFPRDGAPSDEAVSNVIDLVVQLGAELEKAEPSDHVDLSIIQELKDEGFFEELKERYKI